jgi:hypothetical protein
VEQEGARVGFKQAEPRCTVDIDQGVVDEVAGTRLGRGGGGIEHGVEG